MKRHDHFSLRRTALTDRESRSRDELLSNWIDKPFKFKYRKVSVRARSRPRPTATGYPRLPAGLTTQP